jgi:CubicO group peptidase (beta-lactamase class C family)
MHQFDAILQKHVACGEDTQDKLLGAAFAVVDRDGIRHSSSAGRIGPDIGSAPWTVDGSFTWVASLTKLLTSTCLLQLVERGQIGLEDDLREIVPELAGMQILRGFDGEGRPRLEANTRAITLK